MLLRHRGDACTGQAHCAPYLAALGLLLNRTPLYAGPETVVSPDLVEHAYQAFQRFDWTTPELLDLQILFLRAARVVDDRSLDLPMPLRGLIASKLEKSGVPALQTAKIKGFVPIGRSDRARLYDDSLPAGPSQQRTSRPCQHCPLDVRTRKCRRPIGKIVGPRTWTIELGYSLVAVSGLHHAAPVSSPVRGRSP